MLYSKQIEEMIADERTKLVIDVRDESEFQKGSYPDALNIPWQNFTEHTDELSKEMPIYLICFSGKHSLEICEELTPQGYEIYSIEGGIYSYYRYQIENQLSSEDTAAERCKEIERSIIKKFRGELWSQFTKAINTYDLIKDGDKIAVCISGGKDSMLMAKLFQELERHGKKNFEVVYMVMNPGYNRINYETILMGMLYGGQIQTMMPKLHSTNFEGMELIRPLYLIREEDIKKWMNYNELKFINCACRLTESCASCGGTDKGSKRAEIKSLISELRERSPYIEANIFKSVENVSLNTIICYKTADGQKHHFLDDYEQ